MSSSKDSGSFAEEPRILVSKAEYDWLRAMAGAAQAVVTGADLRNDPEFGARWLEKLNELALLVPSTRLYDRNPLT